MRFRLPKRKNEESTSPRVGIIYLVGLELLIDSTPLAEAGHYGEFRIHECSHIAYWEQLVKSRKVPNTEYEQFPRGRIAYHPKSGKFGLLADKLHSQTRATCGQDFVAAEHSVERHRNGHRQSLVLPLLGSQSLTRFSKLQEDHANRNLRTG